MKVKYCLEVLMEVEFYHDISVIWYILPYIFVLKFVFERFVQVHYKNLTMKNWKNHINPHNKIQKYHLKKGFWFYLPLMVT